MLSQTVGQQSLLEARDLRRNLEYQSIIDRYLHVKSELYPEGYHFVHENLKPHTAIEG